MLKLKDLALRPDFKVGPLTISPPRRLVEGPAGSANVEPLIMQVLLLLLDGRGRVVTRDELFDQCWGGAAVGDDSLNRAIGGVRRVFDQVAPGQVDIETVPRTGYRLTGTILEGQNDDRPPDPASLAPRVSRRSLVGGGTAAVAVASLSLWAALRPRTDARFTALVEQADQVLRHEYSERGRSASTILEQALAIHPDNSKALGMLAYAHAIVGISTPPGSASEVPAAERAIRAALAADSKNPHARLALLLLQKSGFDWAATEDGLRGILGDAPRNTLALGWLVALYQAAGRNRLSWKVNEEVIRIDPISPGAHFRRALKHWIFGRTEEAYRVIDRLIQIWPHHPWVWNARFLILAFTGRAPAALDMIDDSASRPPTITPARMAQWRPTLAALDRPSPAAIAVAREANLSAARQSPGQAAYAVMALSGIGEIDAAYQVAEGFLLSKGQIVTRRPSDRANMLVNSRGWRQTQWLSTPPLAKFRLDPRFGALCDGIGLTAYWRLRGIKPDYTSGELA